MFGIASRKVVKDLDAEIVGKQSFFVDDIEVFQPPDDRFVRSFKGDEEFFFVELKNGHGKLTMRFLQKNGFSPEDFCAIVSAEIKREETGLLEFAGQMKLPLLFFPAEKLNAVEVPNPSEAAQRNLGIRSVSEASALLGAGRNARLYVEKQRCEDVTVAIAGGDHDF